MLLWAPDYLNFLWAQLDKILRIFKKYAKVHSRVNSWIYDYLNFY